VIKLECTLTADAIEQLSAACDYLLANKADEHNGRMVLDEEEDWIEYREVNPSFERKAKFVAGELLRLFKAPPATN
jgi:hypothetical protein